MTFTKKNKKSTGARTKGTPTSWTNTLSKTSVTIEEIAEIETIAIEREYRELWQSFHYYIVRTKDVKKAFNNLIM